MKIVTDNTDGILTVAVEGSITVAGAKDFENEIKDGLSYKNMGAKVSSVILDFSKLDYISSAGLRVLLMIKKQMNGKDGLIVKNINDEVREIFKNTGFLKVLEIED